ncbi:MAG: VOC family protein [Dehalococcoidia bacterium]|nr:VOC family protein [Dehalococcoidia bacterium]MCA9829334.1 VOC family protein [Dehalococcoidia bacterium]MCB9485314.1 VOC family protein [Thermoflexaceae bacterium]
MTTARLFRVVLPVSDVERAVFFYATVLNDPGERVSANRHYFDCGGTILALVQPTGVEGTFARPNPDHVYLAVPDLESVLDRCRRAGATSFDAQDQQPGIADRPWGERSFYLRDLDGNPLCFVEQTTEFTGGAFVP